MITSMLHTLLKSCHLVDGDFSIIGYGNYSTLSKLLNACKNTWRTCWVIEYSMVTDSFPLAKNLDIISIEKLKNKPLALSIINKPIDISLLGDIIKTTSVGGKVILNTSYIDEGDIKSKFGDGITLVQLDEYYIITKKICDIKYTSITIACVLRSDGLYDYTYVNNLYHAVKTYSSGKEFRFVCITDTTDNIDAGVECIMLVNNFDKWWSKVELFREDIFTESERIIYLDLDTIVCGDIIDMVHNTKGFVGLRDFYRPDFFASGVMIWNPSPETHFIYNNFLKHSDRIMRNYIRGDQHYISEAKRRINFIQDYMPFNIASFKRDCLKGNDVVIPEHCSIICFHGSPRIHEIQHDTIKSLWHK